VRYGTWEGDEWRCGCSRDTNYDKSINPTCVSRCGICGYYRPPKSEAHPMADQWRVGRSTKRTIWYGEDVVHGMVDLPEIAERICRAMNEHEPLKARVAELEKALKRAPCSFPGEFPGEDCTEADPCATHAPLRVTCQAGNDG